MRILITGASGQLGWALAWRFRKTHEVFAVYHYHAVGLSGVESFRLSLDEYSEVRETLNRINPDVVIHCASRTDLDEQEKDPDGSWRSNVLTTRTIIDALRDLPAKLVYISTDAVYSGQAGPYREEDEAGPRNVYGRTKLEAEGLVASRPDSLILRTNIYGWNIRITKPGIGEWFLRRLEEGTPVPGFTDALFSSIYTSHLAEIVEQCLERRLSGLFNASCRDSWSKFEFGRQLAGKFGYDPELVQPGLLANASLAAPRGLDMRLDVGKLEQALGRNLPTMAEGLQAFYQDWQAGLPREMRRLASEQGNDADVYPRRHTIPYGCQYLDHRDLEAVKQALTSANLTQGQGVEHFERVVAERVRAVSGVAVNSGTSGLHIACLALGIGPGDEVLTSPITFVASANAAAYCGATPRFVDVDPRTINMDPVKLEQAITPATRAVIPVHFTGQSCDMQAIHEVVQRKATEYGRPIAIIEDACHALGSLYHGEPVGSGRWSQMTVFSFHPVKHVTTGEGGLVTTNDPELESRLKRFRSHGIIRPDDPPGPWYYEQVDLGYNYRITDIQCALGRSQMEKLEWFTRRRRAIVDYYGHALRSVPFLTIPYEMPGVRSNFHLYVVRIDFAGLGISRKEYIGQLRARQIITQVHYIPVHYQPYYQKTFGTRPGMFPVAEAYYEQCLSLPLFPAMTDGEVETVVAAVTELNHSQHSQRG